jgi:hypothetical protein
MAKQLQLMFAMRNNAGKLRQQALFLDGQLLRKRSFDVGECADADEGILERLGYQLERPIQKATIVKLHHDSEEMRDSIKAMWLPNHLAIEEDAMKMYLPRNYDMKIADVVTSEKNYWKEYLDPDSNLSFYVCDKLGESSWAIPMGVNDVVMQRVLDPDTGAYFYYNEQTAESIWASLRPNFE